jgi:glycosyltransferase involved in cell wall biosynthesis
MRVLHLFSNCKWTGPAEPALNLAVSLKDLGIEVDFACAPDAGKSVNMVVETSKARGLSPILKFHLHKHRHPWKNLVDRMRLGAHLVDERYDLIHCHLDNDHAIASTVARRFGIPVIRSNYYGDGLPRTPRHARMLKRTRILLEPSQRAREADAVHFGFPLEDTAVVPGAIDTMRFDPDRELPDGRAALGIPADAFVVGIVARMQTHRRYDDLFGALKRLVDRQPNTHLIVVGRGTKQDQVGFTPVKDLGLEDHVHFTGYVSGDDYVGMLKAFDAGVYLVPGSDGTCRAVREIMAMGVPVAAADRGMLGEIVTHGEDGLLFDGTVDGLADALGQWQTDEDLRSRMAQAARTKAETRYALPVQAQQVAGIYEGLVLGGER